MTHSSAVQMTRPPTHVLFSSDLWERALEKYAHATQVTVKLFDTDLRVVFGPIHPTPLFGLFDHGGYDPGLFAECARQCLAQTTKRPAVTVSKAHGLAVVGTSLVLDGKIVGAAVAGYVLVDFSQLSEIERVAKDARIDFTKVWQVAREQSPVSQQRLNVNGELLQVLGDALLRENARTRQYEHTALELEETGRAKESAHQKLQQTASVLRESEQRYRTLFDLGPIAVYSCDASGVIRDYNHVAAELWGREPEPGETDERWCGSFKMLRPDGVVMPHGECPMAEVLSGKLLEVRDGEVQIERPDGSPVTVLVNILPLKNEQGEITGAINCFVDITERKRAERALREAHDQLESLVALRTAAVRKLSSQMIRSQDEERRRISRELHDSVGQQLAYAKISLAGLKKRGNTEEDSKALSELADTLDQCLTETRTISYLLHPPLLDEVGFSSAAGWYVEGFSQRSGIQVSFHIPKPLARLPGDIELVLFRILQESLTNVHRHARTQSVNVNLQVARTEVALEVRDHGKGISPEFLERFRTNGGGGVGLNSMRERINELGGRFEIQSDPSGTLIRVAIPLPKREKTRASSAA